MVFFVYIKAEKSNLYNNYITYFMRCFPNMSDLLIKGHNLKKDTKVLIFTSKTVDTPRKKGYRTKFKKYFFGTIEELGEHILKYYRENVWDKKKAKQIRYNGLLKMAKLHYTNFYYSHYKKNTENRTEIIKEEVKSSMAKFENSLNEFMQLTKRFPDKPQLKGILDYKTAREVIKDATI